MCSETQVGVTGTERLLVIPGLHRPACAVGPLCTRLRSIFREAGDDVLVKIKMLSQTRRTPSRRTLSSHEK